MGANILVGCGGTGIEALIRLNELLSEDTYWRQRLAQDFYYVLVDTETDKLNKFKDKLAQQVEDAKKPFVEIIPLSQGQDSLQQPVNRALVTPFGKDGRSGNSKAKDRLFEHWWRRSDGEIFKAARVKPLATGAGQCPLISYFLAWRYLKRIEDVFAEVIKQVQARSTAANPLDDSSLVITGSIAGGTGRGSWQLLAFKLRQLLAKIDRMPKPIVFLSDVSVFGNIMKKFPRQELPMRVNALTGFSELDAWMQNVKPQEDKPPKRIEYRLPSFDKADDFDADVLQLPPGDETAYAPVDAAFLTFGHSGRAYLDDNMDAHQMVGASLYAALTRVAIRGGMINDSNMQYWGVAAATFEVPATTLGRYFEKHACIHTLDDLTNVDKEAARRRADEFIRSNPGILASGIKNLSPDVDGDALDRTWHFLVAESAQDWENLETILSDEQDAQQAIDLVDATKRPTNRAVNAAIKLAFDKVDPVNAVISSATKFFFDEQSLGPPAGADTTRRQVSLATVKLFVQEVIERVDASLARLEKEQFVIPTDGGLAEEIRLLSGREYLFAGKHFNAVEIARIYEEFKRFVLVNNLELIKAKIKEQVAAWKADLTRFASSITVYVDVCEKVRQGYQDELSKEFDTNGYDPFDQLFTNPEQPDAAIPDQFDPDRFYRRDVKPVLTREQMTEMLASGLRSVDFGPIDKLIRANVFDKPLTKSKPVSVSDMANVLRSTVNQNVALDRTFIRQHFSLKPIIIELRNVWQTFLEKQLGRRQTYESMAGRFATFFGVTPTESNNSIQLGTSPEDFVARMGASLASRCKPYWQIDDDVDSECSITLFMPHWGGDELARTKTQIEDTIRLSIAHSTTRVDVVTEEGKMANPFVMLAYSTATVNDLREVRSLDYWREPEVKRMLEKCESPEGRSLFDPRTNGVGFTDPMYVRNTEIAGMRWRPWYGGDHEQLEQKALAIDALIYAMLEPTEELKSQLDKHKWSLPLITIQKGKVSFTRQDLLWDRGKVRENPQCPWTVGAVIDDSIGKFHARLDGSTTAGANGRAIRDTIIAEANRFWGGVTLKLGYGPGTDQRTELLELQQERLSKRKNALRDTNREVIARMIDSLADKLN